ncbi:MAG: TMEM43 family protein, partial [Rhodospirillaceae bacterium]
MDRYREVTRTSFGSRLGNSFIGILIGLLLAIAAFPLLWWNEGRSVDRIKTLDEGLGLVIPVDAMERDPGNQGALIHISGTATGDGPLQDPLFGIETDALKLRRHVEMYQWVEEKTERRIKETGGSERVETTYDYYREWSATLEDSSSFRYPDGHLNPRSMPFEAETQSAQTITLGRFALDGAFTGQMTSYQDLPLGPAVWGAAAPEIQNRFALTGDWFQQGSADNPQVGDVRVKFGVVPSGPYSAVGQQSGDGLALYRTKNGEIALLEQGNVSATEMFAIAQDENTLITWAIRLGGFVLMWIGLSMLLGPIKILADILPFLGRIVGGGIGLLTGLVAFCLSFLT